MMELSFDWVTLNSELDKAGEEYREALDAGFQKAGISMVRKFQEEQLSGRKSGDIYLNVKTGNLRNSLRSMVTSQAGQVEGVVYNQGAQYWGYHQDGTEKHPKRLFIEEDFEVSGEKRYASAVDMAMDTLR
jgi:hypothetical protein